MGPMIRERDAVRVSEWIGEAVQQGAKIVCGGSRTGTLHQPTLVADVKPSMRIARDELFGPAVGVSKAANVEEAIGLANQSRYGLSAGIFTHNQAEWYVQAVLQRAEAFEGECKVRHVEWALAPLGSGLETAGPTAVLNGTLASAPESAPAAVKAVVAAANSITSSPYVWGGGHGSWYSYGYDCSGAVSFALYGSVPRYDGGDRRLRSDHSFLTDPTEVRLEFTVGGTRWRVTRAPEYERPAKRGGGLTLEPARAELEEWVDRMRGRSGAREGMAPRRAPARGVTAGV